MKVVCPRCSSSRLRVLRRRGIGAFLRTLAGIEEVVCRDCGARFQESLTGASELLYAKCPRCFRTDLSSWDLRHYSPRFAIRLQLALGASRYRCDRCRVNFASFRRRQEWPEEAGGDSE